MSFEERLIELIQTKNFLFDTKSKNYKNINLRDKAWLEISQHLDRPSKQI